MYNQLRLLLRPCAMVRIAIGECTMPKKDSCPLLKEGDRVRILHSQWSGRIVEWRGPLGPGGAQIYRVRVRLSPKSIYLEVRRIN